jgi:hypothetical protein
LPGGRFQPTRRGVTVLAGAAGLGLGPPWTGGELAGRGSFGDVGLAAKVFASDVERVNDTTERLLPHRGLEAAAILEGSTSG